MITHWLFTLICCTYCYCCCCLYCRCGAQVSAVAKTNDEMKWIMTICHKKFKLTFVSWTRARGEREILYCDIVDLQSVIHRYKPRCECMCEYTLRMENYTERKKRIVKIKCIWGLLQWVTWDRFVFGSVFITCVPVHIEIFTIRTCWYAFQNSIRDIINHITWTWMVWTQ